MSNSFESVVYTDMAQIVRVAYQEIKKEKARGKALRFF
jgi:hypothetical protein